MPLEPYPRGAIWWARGKVEYNGRPITGYIRESTFASTEDGAQDWIAEREEGERRRHLLGEQHRALTFNDALLLYTCDMDTADHLVPIAAEIGAMLVGEITPKLIRDLGPKLYPANCTDSWRRWVVTPARAVINNAHDELGGARCPAIKVRGYGEAARVAQDKKRKKPSRIEQIPGSWDWLLKFRQHAKRYHAALALFMFITGRRVGQSVAMHPDDLDLQGARVKVPGAKGHDDAWISIPMEMVVELANLPPKTPRGWDRTRRANLRVFGFAGRCSPLKGWQTACKRAGIPYIPPHAAGRHGFGQEHVVRQGTDAQAAASYGAWSDTVLLARTYTHAEDVSDKILAGFRAGLVQAENRTGLKLLRSNG